MRTFKHFPENKICRFCGNGDDKECTLIKIDGTEVGNICQAVPVHVECVMKGDLRYNRGANVFYKIGVPLSDNHAGEKKAGQKYQPLTAVEVEMFATKFCDHCRFADWSGPHRCLILGSAITAQEYPREWQYGEDGRPLCTKFESKING